MMLYIKKDSHSPALSNLFISPDASICSAMAFPPLGNSDHVVPVSIDFPSNSQWDALFHHLAHDYSRTDWDGLHDHLKDAPWEDINVVLLLLLVNFVIGFKLGLRYISLIESIRSSLTHLHGFQLLVQLP